jgi:cyanophycinase
MTTFLIGGGRDPQGARAAHAPFLDAVAGRRVLCVCLDEPERWLSYLEGVDARAVHTPSPGDLDGVAGVYVAGGPTPACWDVVCDSAFGAALRAWDGVYCGYSAGAAIAAASALVGGWRIGDRQVCDPDVGEGLEQVEVRPGLGRLPFTIEVHASQWGTLTRLVQAVHAGLCPTGVAVDEHTCVEADGGDLRVHGRGCAYRAGLGTLHVLTPA